MTIGYRDAVEFEHQCGGPGTPSQGPKDDKEIKGLRMAAPGALYHHLGTLTIALLGTRQTPPAPYGWTRRTRPGTR